MKRDLLNIGQGLGLLLSVLCVLAAFTLSDNVWQEQAWFTLAIVPLLFALWCQGAR